MARIEVDVDPLDYLYEIDTDDLVNEIARRKNKIDEPLNAIRVLLGLREWHDKKRIIQEIEQL